MKIFKNRITLLLLSVFFIGVLMTSCTNDDDTPAEGSIIGRWALDKESYTANGMTSPELDYENSDPGCALNDYFEFKDDNVFETGYYSSSCVVSTSVGGEWTKTGNNIFINFPADPEENATIELISLSPTQMKIRIDLTGTEGVEPGVILFINYTLVKVN